MGNAIDKGKKGNKIYINSLVRNFLSDGNKTNKNSEYFEKLKSPNNTFKKTNIKFKNKNIIESSIIFAEEIIKNNLLKEFNSHMNIYSGLLVFKDIDQIEENNSTHILNEENEEELSNANQIKSTQNILFPKDSYLKNLNKIEKLLNLYGINAHENKIENKLEINFSGNGLNKENKIYVRNQNLLPTTVSISNSLNIVKENKTFFGSNDYSNLKQSQSVYNGNKDKSFEDISLQEYLKMETERLKKDENFLNFKKRKDSNEVIIQNNKKSLNEKLDDSSIIINDFKIGHFDPSIKTGNKNMIKKYNLNIMKNKHLDKFEKNNKNLSSNNVSNRFSHSQIQMQKLIENNNKHQITNTNNKPILLLKSNKSTSHLTLNQSNNKFINNFNKLKTSKTEKENFDNSKDNTECYSERKQNLRYQEKINNNHNLTNSTTKNTSRAPSNRDKIILNSPKKFDDKENDFKNGSMSSRNNSRNLIKINSQKQLSHYSDNKINNYGVLNTIESAKTNLINSIKNKPPIASIKIDIRDLLKDDFDINIQNIEKIENNKNIEMDLNYSTISTNKKSEEIAEYISKFNNTNKSYSEIKDNVEKENQIYNSNDQDIKDLIIVKQRVDKNGKIIIKN